MNPISLLTGSLQLAEAVTQAGFGLQHLQQEFGGALEHVDTIAQQTGCIDVAIREICSWLCRSSSDNLSSAFVNPLRECIDAVDETIRQIQDHCQYVKSEAEKSPIKGRLLHMSRTGKVLQWNRNLGAQIQVLMLMLHVVKLRSDSEKTSALSQDFSKKIFEKASSMSAKINNSSRAQSVDHLSIEIQSFDFDPSLLDTKVYRRACESSLKREVTLHKSNDEQDPLPSSSALFNNAVADRSDELFDKRDSDVDKVTGHDITPFCDTNQDHTQNMRLCRFLESTRLPRVAGSPLLSEESTRETQFSTIETNLTTSTKATTQFSTSNLRASCEAVYASKAVASRSKVMVTIERVGCDDIELPARCHQYFNVIQDTIFHIRDRILTSNGIEKSRYNIAAAKCTIETHGEHNHKFPLTEAFLNAALEMLDQDAYKAIEIHAIFSLPAKSTGDGAGSIVASKLREGSLTRKWTDDLVAVGSRTWSILRMSFSEDKTDKSLGNSETFIRKGGFSTVFRAELHAASLFHSHLIAVKRLNHTDNEEFWRREVMTLKRIRDAGGHDHVLELLGTFSSEGTGPCLMFPWADGGNLRDYWKLNQPPQDLCSIQWTWRQFTGLASGLQKIHRVLNESCPSSEVSYGRHGDIKPENILWFTQHDESGDGGRLVIADFGLTTFHSNSSQSQNGAGSRPALTPAYRAPEWDIPSLVQREPASSYDIWSLGCVFLEFAVWICEGPDGVDKFRYSRYAHSREGLFFLMDENRSFDLNPAVSQQHAALKFKPIGLDSLFNCLNLEILHCLSIQPEDRPSSSLLADRLNRLSDELRAEPNIQEQLTRYHMKDDPPV